MKTLLLSVTSILLLLSVSAYAEDQDMTRDQMQTKLQTKNKTGSGDGDKKMIQNQNQHKYQYKEEYKSPPSVDETRNTMRGSQANQSSQSYRGSSMGSSMKGGGGRGKH